VTTLTHRFEQTIEEIIGKTNIGGTSRMELNSFGKAIYLKRL